MFRTINQEETLSLILILFDLLPEQILMSLVEHTKLLCIIILTNNIMLVVFLQRGHNIVLGKEFCHLLALLTCVCLRQVFDGNLATD